MKLICAFSVLAVVPALVLAGCQDPTHPGEASPPQFADVSDSPVIFDPALYTALQVFEAGAGNPGINNHGEIVYLSWRGGEEKILTTRARDVTIPGSSQLLEPTINDGGEVVYRGHLHGSGPKILSSIRGNLSQNGNSVYPDINNLGTVSFTHYDFEFGTWSLRTLNGTEYTTVVSGFSARSKINDSGVVAYVYHDGIYTASPGGTPQLRVAGSNLLLAFNNHGDIVYTKQIGDDRLLLGPNDVQLAAFPVWGLLDMNDHGDIVVNTPFVVNGIQDVALVLLTQHPEDFPYPPFEPNAPDTDGDGVPDDEDPFPNSNTDPFVSVGGCATDVMNHFFPDGATFNDLIGAAAASAKNHGQFVSAVTRMANEWNKAGWISGNEKGSITACAGG